LKIVRGGGRCEAKISAAKRARSAKKPRKIFDFLLARQFHGRFTNARRQIFRYQHTEKNNMAKALTKSQIAASVAEKTGITKKTAAEVLEFIADLAYKNAKNSFTLPGLGKLVLVNRKARMGRNPATGQEIKIPAKKVVKFRVAKACKDAVLGAKM
jgi:DNA-binding protein HU-beta